MPAQRSLSTRHLTRHSLRQPLSAQHASKASPHEVIELSSDDEAPPPVSRKSSIPPRATRAKGKAKKTPVSSSSSAHNTLANLQKQMEELQRENATLKAKVASTSSHAKSSSSDSSQKATAELATAKALISDLDESTCCEVCYCRMFSPYILACGHAFCRACLTDWFSTTLIQHMITHPEYTPHPTSLGHYMHYLRQPGLQPPQRRQAEEQLKREYDRIRKPCYTCPKCRDEVEYAPIGCFVLKSVARAVAKWNKEGGQEKDFEKENERTVWDGFFPKMPKLPKS
ncbi:hypothetical protein BDY19DRAFT_922702 [Irpex rosettiformis]|uniref:Uncharacterized protein n=1 Tax=Irpex rosettiformis TaxID=378272 RepID=A0ACB8UG16_9APHY|nr:hypothetical protein BDY19DRAFT_922702 [Irpex rosettiformis]